ncbi:12247_t:CDS:2 [Ambispora leptoticha]|uniref:12247_t:CDS:1 n=1 Tax=Ambispora leptoticha TaxID=144679 RepID=A0A9N8VTQ6_9GLOM|nr:12247_t:CDS:2 [Ambispora leptoticha]
MADKQAQTYIDNPAVFAKSVTKIEVDHSLNNLIGDLIIKDFPNLTDVILRNHGLTSVTVESCPNLSNINVSNNRNLVSFNLEKTTIINGENAGNKVKVVKISGYSGKPSFEEINLKNCTSLEGLFVNDLGKIRTIKGVKDFDNPIREINMGGSEGFNLTTTDELERLEAVEKVSDEILGGSGNLPMTIDPGTGKQVVNVAKLKEDLVVKGAENPDSPTKKIVEAVIVELGLRGTNITQQQIIDEIRKLKDRGEIDKLESAASARDVEISKDKLISGRFNELQMLRDKKLLPGQEDEKTEV